MRFTIYLFIVALSFSCAKKALKENVSLLTEDFESVINVDELTEGDSANWRYYQHANGENNYIEIDTTNPHTGNQCLKFFAESTKNGRASKSDLAHNDIVFWAGESFQFIAWFYIEGDENQEYITLADFEDNPPIGAGPGFRLTLRDAEGHLAIERGKMQEPTLYQTVDPKVPFPRNEWVELKLEVQLSKKDKGQFQLWQNGILILDAKNVKTVPTDHLGYIQGTHGAITSVQVGASAASPNSDVTMYVDDVSLIKL